MMRPRQQPLQKLAPQEQQKINGLVVIVEAKTRFPILLIAVASHAILLRIPAPLGSHRTANVMPGQRGRVVAKLPLNLQEEATGGSGGYVCFFTFFTKLFLNFNILGATTARQYG